MAVPNVSIAAQFQGIRFDSIAGVIVYATNPYESPSRTLNLQGLARRSARKLTSGFFTARQLSVSMYILGGSRDGLDAIMDKVMAMIQSLEGTLLLPYGGKVRQWTASYSTKTTNQIDGGFGDFTFVFEASDSFGYDPTYSQIENAPAQTAGSATINWTQGGSAATQAPLFQVKINSGTGLTGSITIGNQNTGQAITVTRTFNPGDILQINTQAPYPFVQVNGVDVPFTGGWPVFGLGAQTAYYLDTFTTRNVDRLFYVYNRYA